MIKYRHQKLTMQQRADTPRQATGRTDVTGQDMERADIEAEPIGRKKQQDAQRENGVAPQSLAFVTYPFPGPAPEVQSHVNRGRPHPR